MKAVSPPSKMSVFVYGMPRSGTTIIASLLNSIEGATVWGEPHRSSHMIYMGTRYGNVLMDPGHNILDQIESFATHNELWLYGFKEVFDPALGIFLHDLVGRYFEKLDKIIICIRDPRKVWASMAGIGHATELGLRISDFSEAYLRHIDFAFEHPKASGAVLDLILANPILLSGVIGVQLHKYDGLRQYTGGGDPHTIQGGAILRSVDARPPYTGHELYNAFERYMEFREWNIRQGSNAK